MTTAVPVGDDNVKLLVIYNSSAGHGKAAKQLSKVRSTASELDLDLEIVTTASPQHANEHLQSADLNRYDGVLAAGGDGSVFHVLNGLLTNPHGATVPLGVLPVGTGNSFSRDLGLGTGMIETSLQGVAQRRTRHVDIGRVTANGSIFHFLNVLGLGFVSEVTVTASRLKAFGGLSYTLGVLHRIIRLRTHDLHIELDGSALDGEVIFVEISNSRYTADYLIAPAALIDDGLFDVTIVRPMRRGRLLRLFPLVFSGEHVKLAEVETYQVRNIRITAEEEKPLAPDGELHGTTPVEIECLHQAIEMFTAPEAPP
ncbi:MAG: diacylglycerol kinase family lipid kinase [bacterium]|nr:diacylglycerol kinase family lipid kinase [bacterium]